MTGVLSKMRIGMVHRCGKILQAIFILSKKKEYSSLKEFIADM